MITVKSKTVNVLDYKPEEKVLLVKFNSGVWYQYEDVSLKEYEEIKDADSVGSTLRRVLTNKQYKKI